MQAFAFVLILCVGAVSTTLASTSREVVQDNLNSLPEDLLRDIGSRLPIADRYRFSLASLYLREIVGFNDAEIVSARLFSHFGDHCLLFALLIEDAPPGCITKVVAELSTKYDDSSLYFPLDVVEYAKDVGHFDLIDDISANLSDRVSNDNVARLASLPLSDLLGMHALPKQTFLEVLDAKYNASGYDSFFKDPVWNSNYFSRTVMSHALDVYKKLNGTIDFEPVPFGYIASTQTMSEQTRLILRNMTSSGTNINTMFFFLQTVLSPGSEMEFFSTLSIELRTEFLILACLTGRLDWVCPVRVLHSCCVCC